MNQKLEEQLRLALLTPEEIREKTVDLNVGYLADGRRWTLIVKYHGELSKLKALDIEAELLPGGYAILTVPENLVETVADFEEIEYVEKPKSFDYGQVDPASDSCITELPGRGFSLTGKDVLIAVLDSGVNIDLPVFRDKDGVSRVEAYQDQTQGERMTDVTGHGTSVASVAAGNGQTTDGTLYRGIATEATLLVVKLGTPGKESFPRTAEIMRGIAWAIRQAAGRPLVINLSFGNSYGDHNGNSILEQYLNQVSGIGRTVICVGSGNEGTAGTHLAGEIKRGESSVAELSVGAYERNVSLQIWTRYGTSLALTIAAPDGTRQRITQGYGTNLQTLPFRDTVVYAYSGEPTPYSMSRELYLEWIPEGKYTESGIWTLYLENTGNDVISYDCYLQSAEGSARFYRPSADKTLTIPSSADKVITVGAYDSGTNSYAPFSGRGPAYYSGKPELAAPGVSVSAVSREGSMIKVTGTSFAVPIVSGAAALLMEWGIVKGNDPFLYGEKLKAYLLAGAETLRGEPERPNNKSGWGKLCVYGSLPAGNRGNT